MTTPPVPLSFNQAVAREEGFGTSPNNRPTRNNNPGDLEWGTFAEQHGATRIETCPPHVIPRFAYFPTMLTGQRAQAELLRLHYCGLTVRQALNKYAPPVENDTSAYEANVCKWTGLSPLHILAEQDFA